MRNILLWLIVLVLAPSVLTAQETEEVERVSFVVTLSPSNEVPPVTDSEITGVAEIGILIRRVVVDPDLEEEEDLGNGDDITADEILSAVVDFNVTYVLGQPETLVAMHIHRGARGVNGPVVINSELGGPIMAEPGTGTIFRQVEIDDPADVEIVAEILANPENFYLNVHSSSHPGGLIRGQLREPPAVVTGNQLDRIEAKVDKLDRDLTLIKRRLAIPD